MANWLKELGTDNVRPTAWDQRTMNFFSTFSVWIGANVVITTVFTGMFFVPDISFFNALLVILIGSALGSIPLMLMSNIGTKTGLPSMVISKAAYGSKGAILPAIVNTITLISWSWIQAYMAGLSLDYAVKYATGYSNINLFTILTEVLVVIIVLYGHRGIELTERWVATAMLILSAAVFIKLFTTYSIGSLITMKLNENPTTTTMIAFDIVIATAFSWMSSVADYNRNCKSVKMGMTGIALGYTLGTVIAMALGAAVSGISILNNIPQTYDPTQLLAKYGFGFVAAIVVFFSVISTNVMALYSATMSFLVAFPRMSFWKPTIVMGVLCTIGSLLKDFLLANFFNFILMIATLFIPVFAVIIVDHFLVKRGFYDAEEIIDEQKKTYYYTKGFNFRAYGAYLAGAIFAYFFTYVHPLATGATIWTFLLTGGLYYLLMLPVGYQASIDDPKTAGNI